MIFINYICKSQRATYWDVLSDTMCTKLSNAALLVTEDLFSGQALWKVKTNESNSNLTNIFVRGG